MRLVLPALLVLGGLSLAACSSDGPVCPTGWSSDSNAPGSCQAPTSFTASLPTGLYGFMRTDTHGSDQLVVGADVFVLPASADCSAASVNALATTTTNQDGIFTFALQPGSYLLTSGEVPSCVQVQVDANNPSDVPLVN